MADILRLIAEPVVRPVYITKIQQHQQGYSQDNAANQGKCTHYNLAGLLIHNGRRDNGNQIPVGIQLQRDITENGIFLLIGKGGPSRFPLPQRLCKTFQPGLAVFRYLQHIKKILYGFVTVGMGRPDEDIAVCIQHIGKACVLIERNSKCVNDPIHLILFDEISFCTVFQRHLNKQVKYIDTSSTADMRGNDSLFLVILLKYFR